MTTKASRILDRGLVESTTATHSALWSRKTQKPVSHFIHGHLGAKLPEAAAPDTLSWAGPIVGS